MTLKRLLLSRGTVVAFIAGVAALLTVASLVPQSFLAPPAEIARWRGAHPLLAPVVAALGLGHVYTHPIFLALLLLAAVALALSGVEQLRVALRRTSPASAPVAGGTALEVEAAPAEVVRALRGRGYVPLRRGAAGSVLVRHPWGYWGNVLLHAGLVTVVAASAVIAVTQQRATLHLVEGQTQGIGGPWFAEENGIGARRLVLPFDVRLEHLEYRFWPTQGLERATSTLSLRRPGQSPQTLKVGIDDLQVADGIRIYQGAELGHAFEVIVTGAGSERRLTLLIPHPPGPDSPGVNEFRELPGGDLLRAKYWVDPERRSFEAFNPVLHLRVDRGGASLGEASLRPGTSATVGPYQFRLAQVRVWTRLFFVRIVGIAGVFAGFFVIALGGALHFFTPPREAFVEAIGPGRTRLTWRAARFEGFYAEELEAIRAGLREGSDP